MKKRQISIIIIVLTAITAYGQEQLWQQCNENLPGEIRIMPARCSDNNHQVGAKASVEFTLDEITTHYGTRLFTLNTRR